MSREEQIRNLLQRNVVEVVDRKRLERRLLAGEKLRVKLGIDPTAPDLHLGHAVVLRKLREFQDLGCKAVLIIGDFTARIGDPSGRTEARRPLSDTEIKKNMESYLAQAGKIIDLEKAEIFYNSDWFGKEGVEKIVELASAASIQQVLRRADFKKRLEGDKDVSLLELLYPVFQGYDSVKVRADVEIGGTDQTFNLLMSRKIQRHFGEAEQDILTVPLLEGTDGVKKMSKSAGNYIGLAEKPQEMFGKVMSVNDKLIGKYFLLCTDLDEAEIKNLEKSLKPRDLKAKLALEIVKIYHGEKAAKVAMENFDKVFSRKEMPTDLPELKTSAGTTPFLLALKSGVAKSNSEARRLIKQGAEEINGVIKKDPNEKLNLKGGEIIRIGKKKFFRVKLN